MLIVLTVFFGSQSFAAYPNPENQMLSNTLTNFMYYATQDPRGFSNPRSLIETERRAKIAEYYYVPNNNSYYQNYTNTNNYQINSFIFSYYYNKPLIFTRPNP